MNKESTILTAQFSILTAQFSIALLRSNGNRDRQLCPLPWLRCLPDATQATPPFRKNQTSLKHNSVARHEILPQSGN